MFGLKWFNFFLDNFLLRTFVEKCLYDLFQVFDFIHMHPLRAMRRKALAEQVEYISEKMPLAVGFCSQRDVLNYALDQVSIHGIYVEFGVYKGGTLRFLAKKRPAITFHGFDSFEGLPENWGGYSLVKGDFSTKGHLPRMPKNVCLHKGLFEEVLPLWVQQTTLPIAFMHIDSDLYSSAKTIFKFLGEKIRKGSVVVFDDYFGVGRQQHDHKAFQEFVRQQKIQYKYLCYGVRQVAICIIETQNCLSV